MKKIYIKLLGLVSLNFNFSMINDECDLIEVTMISKNTKSNKECETVKVSSEVRSLLNFFDLMNLVLGLDYLNFKAYQGIIVLYNNNLIDLFNDTSNLVPSLNEENYKKYSQFHKDLNTLSQNHIIELNNPNNYLLIDINSHLMRQIISNSKVSGIDKILKNLEGKNDNLQYVYNDIFFGSKVFHGIKEHIFNNNFQLNNDFLKKFIVTLQKIMTLLNNINFNKNIKQGLNLKNILNYFSKAINDFKINEKEPIYFQDLINNPSKFFKDTHTNQHEVMFILSRLIENHISFNHKQFIAPGLTELLIFKKDLNNETMDFDKLNAFIFDYWTSIMPELKNIEQSNKKLNNTFSFEELNNLLKQLRTSAKFYRIFNDLIAHTILPRNKEIILKSQEVLLSVNLNDKNHIFFITSEFVNKLVDFNNEIKIYNHNNHKSDHIENLDDELIKLIELFGINKKDSQLEHIKDYFTISAIRGLLFSDVLKHHLNPLIKANNHEFIIFLEELNNKLINMSNIIKNTELNRIIINLLKLNENMRNQENVENIFGLVINEETTGLDQNKIPKALELTHTNYDGTILNKIELNKEEWFKVYGHERVKKLGNFAENIFKVNKKNK